ncbi:SDR family oxidoreductase [Calycomorphotria hydatis]|uniref:3-oxoacyl-[acyl-carrier-protein] reductase FabG n=1 Tax=Calycomorphotria hydatis TaxID=2528027 RepID=A0A517T4D9_9PLAN|nr:SDR family oxidoreductase [Calycomorphotria hydatis]QDT63238.1 3-oxoacyl-[acyl-carrier-protein] reductase FabG [Calycomorphotria hydatis]
MAVDVKNAVALVTGANRGIGKAITETLLKHGAAKVYAAVRDPSSAKSLVDTHGDKVVPIALDLTKPDTIQAAAEKASDATIVVNNAGVLQTATVFTDNYRKAFEFELEVNVFGLMEMARAFAPVLKANGVGVFVQLNSVASLRNFPDFTTYCASKAASYSITQALRHQLSEQGTQVVSVHPGPIATDMADDAGLAEIAEPPELVGEAIINALETGDFHAFPDTLAKDIGGAYESFSKSFVETEMAEA